MIRTVIFMSSSLNRFVAMEEDGEGHVWTLRRVHHDYAIGRTPPRYPVPAIIHTVIVTPWGVKDNPFHNTVLITEIREQCCAGCGGWMETLAAAFDFEPERCRRHFLPLGQYVNNRQLREARKASKEFHEELTTPIQ